ncbi:MAG: geranylgeranylglyceryl/heptaprenylglyceryl phosphate synthase [Methanomassiliicoccales archaeon]
MIGTGRVLDYILSRLKEGKLHMTLIDPDKQSPERASEMARKAADAGTSAIMVGGSTGVDQEKTDRTVLSIKRAASVPVIAFPSSAAGLSRHLDAVFFLSVLNSREPENIIRAQSKGALIVKKLGIEAIGMGYVVVAPGMRVGQVSNAEAVERDDPGLAVSYALAAEYLGMKLVYLEAGSGAPAHVPCSMISAVKNEISIPLIVGGGIRTLQDAIEVSQSGADIIVTGTIAEEDRTLAALEAIIRGLRASH